ncbi:MAG: MaoC/PaaZ C-terminal domain-containing protein [Chitinophagales bacterium]
MSNIIQLKSLPNTASLYARIASTLIKKGNGNLPDLKIQFDNQIIQPGDVKKYNKVCGFDHTLIVPSTYIHTRVFELQAILLTHPACPFPYPGLIVFANTIKQTRSLYVGEEFNIICSFGNLVAHEKGQAFEIYSAIEVKGKRIWEETMVFLYKGKEGIGSVFEMYQPQLAENCIKKSWSLHQTLGLEYAQASGDFNPIHLHTIPAKLFGFPKHLIHGMWSQSKVLVELEKQLSDSFEFAVAFKTPIFLPASVIFRYEKTDKGFNFDVVDKTQQKPHLKGYIYNC